MSRNASFKRVRKLAAVIMSHTKGLRLYTTFDKEPKEKSKEERRHEHSVGSDSGGFFYRISSRQPADLTALVLRTLGQGPTSTDNLAVKLRDHLVPTW